MGSQPLQSIFNMDHYFYLFMGLALLSICVNSMSKKPCGPPDCELFCPPGECIENDVLNCVDAPCCQRWHCQLKKLLPPTPPPSTSCPEIPPYFNTPCIGDLKCPYGERECCGEKIPEQDWVCTSGSWTYIHDLICPVCNSCPEEAPDFNTFCTVNSTLKCPYGSQECCGKILHDREMICSDGTWIGFYLDTSCRFGLACD